MDWLRRNWPDLIIGIALVAVIAGIVVTLLSGGSVLSLGGREANPTLPPQPAAQTGTQDEVQPAAPNNQLDETPDETGVVVVPPGAESGNGAEGTDEGADAIIPVTPGGAAPERAGEADETPQDGALTDAPTAPAESERTDDLTSDEPTDLPVVAVPPGEVVVSGGANGIIDVPPPEGTYRVSVDAYASRENAERRAAELRDEGYPVFIGQQGDLSLVLVGPYDAPEDANEVTQRLRDSGLSLDAYVVVYRPETATEAGVTSVDAPTTTDVQTADVQTADTQASAESDPLQEDILPADASGETDTGTALTDEDEAGGARYLQVGAFASRSSAEPRLTRLESLGYSVSQTDDNGVIKLFVGPFAPAELPAAQARLDAQGLENFVPASQ